jgi:hypothetical protein
MIVARSRTRVASGPLARRMLRAGGAPSSRHYRPDPIDLGGPWVMVTLRPMKSPTVEIERRGVEDIDDV